jgi:hypothetical protein
VSFAAAVGVRGARSEACPVVFLDAFGHLALARPTRARSREPDVDDYLVREPKTQQPSDQLLPFGTLPVEGELRSDVEQIVDRRY